MELNPEMSIHEAADIIEDAESNVWDEGFFGMVKIGDDCRFDSDKITLREACPVEHFVVYATIGGNEGIYLHVEGMRKDGKRNTIISAKSLMHHDSEHWDKCWVSAGRISKALNQMYW